MSSSNSEFERITPLQPWGRVFLTVVLITVIFITGWEIFWRVQGYIPTYNDTPDLWASWHAKLNQSSSDTTVIIGASRTMLDLDLDAYEQQTGKRPIQLGIVGNSIRPVLAHLADNEAFSGTLIVGVTPILFFAVKGPFTAKSENWIAYANKWTPTQKFGHRILNVLETRLAFSQKDYLSLQSLVDLIEIPNRPKVFTFPSLLYLWRIESDRRAVLRKEVEHNEAFRRTAQLTWKEAWPKMYLVSAVNQEEAILELFAEVKKSVDKIKAKGGQVIFIRPPSSGEIRQLETQQHPREKYWDRLLTHTGAPGIHFEDYPALVEFECLEWSHLSQSDSVEFTKRLIPILNTKLRKH